MIFKAKLKVADLNRQYYHDHALTLARHPSETDERLMVRLLAYALNATDGLAFANGLSDPEQADVWRKDLQGKVSTWIDVGLPADKWIKRACGQAQDVRIYAYGGRAASQWWQESGTLLSAFSNLSVFELEPTTTRALAQLAQRTMALDCTIQDDQIWLGDGNQSVEFQLITLMSSQTPVRPAL